MTRGISDDEISIFSKGAEARREGLKKWSNPYPRASTNGAMWLAGWEDQDKLIALGMEPESPNTKENNR